MTDARNGSVAYTHAEQGSANHYTLDSLDYLIECSTDTPTVFLAFFWALDRQSYGMDIDHAISSLMKFLIYIDIVGPQYTVVKIEKKVSWYGAAGEMTSARALKEDRGLRCSKSLYISGRPTTMLYCRCLTTKRPLTHGSSIGHHGLASK